MGIIDLLFNTKSAFVPNPNETEYENWLNFVREGGTTAEWNQLKKENKWKFKKDPTTEFMRYEKEFRPAFKKYSDSAAKVKNDWLALYHSKNYTGIKAKIFEKTCLKNIEYYKVVFAIEEKYKEDHMTSIEGSKRLAMLYENQGRYEEAVSVCKEACILKAHEHSRMKRMIKKAGRIPTAEEMSLIEGSE